MATNLIQNIVMPKLFHQNFMRALFIQLIRAAQLSNPLMCLWKKPQDY